MTTPTPTPSDTLTKTMSPEGESPRRAQTSASAQAFTAFSMTTGRPRLAARGARRATSRQPSAGACTTTSPERSSIPGKAIPTPSQRPAPAFSASTRRTSWARCSTKSPGSRSVGKLSTAESSRPTRSVIARKVRVTRTSTATAQRSRESRWRIVGRRPRAVVRAFPSHTRPWAIRSATMRPMALLCMPRRRASSARDISWCERSSPRMICWLMARGVSRVAGRSSRGRRIGTVRPC